MALAQATQNRVPVSLRLPAKIVQEIDCYAEKHSMRKTEAYVHFLELGLAAPAATGERKAYERLSAQMEEVLALLQPKEGKRVETKRAAMRAIDSVAHDFPAIERAYLFGSFARGDQRAESDVDVRLVLDREKRFNLRDLSRFAKRLEQATQRECDIVTADVIEDAALAKSIEEEGILAYERKTQ